VKEFTYKISTGWFSTRTYFVSVPDSYNGTATPAIINLHGGGGNVKQYKDQTDMDTAAEAHGFISIWCDGSAPAFFLPDNKTWNADTCCGYALSKNIDDVGFLAKVITDVKKRFKISKIFMSGFSNGAMMAYKFAVSKPTMVDGIAPVSGELGIIPTALMTSPVPIIHIHGLQDTNCPFDGGVGAGSIIPCYHNPVLNCIDYFVKSNKCSPYGFTTTTDDYIKYSFNSIPGGKEIVQLYVLPNGGHQWPGGNYVPAGSGEVVKTVDACNIILDFFRGL